MTPSNDATLRRAVAGQRLIDHHAHGALRAPTDRATWGGYFVEADTDPCPPGVEPLDSQVGFAVRRWCAPLLDLPAHAEPEEYWDRRRALGEAEVTRRFLTAAGVERWLLDTGHGQDRLLGLGEMARVSGGAVHEVVRLESLAEDLARRATPAAAYPDAFRALLAERTRHAAATKSVAAYRCGFRIDIARPGDERVVRAYAAWCRAESDGSAGGPPAAPRLVDPVLVGFGMHEAVATGLPMQLHVGLGDREMNLRDSDPLLLTEFLRDAAVRGVNILLLHCYPYERQAGYLAQAFGNVYLDAGLALTHLGARSAALVERLVELAPLRKILYSSDGYGPAELHYLGSRMWRNGLLAYLRRVVDADEWSMRDALRVVAMTGRENALRAYPSLSTAGFTPADDG